MAETAILDGEVPATPSDVMQAHLSTCRDCQRAIPELRRLFAGLNTLEYGNVPADLWSDVRSQLPRSLFRPRRERAAIGLVFGIVVAWRVAQLALDLPLPVINSVVPLIAAVAIIWRFIPNALAIEPRIPQEVA